MNEDEGRLVGGRYRLGDVLGRGGMGTVWRAEDEILGRTVAVKELRFPSSVDEDERQRLITRTLREAKAIARVRSGSAVTVFDVVDEDDRPWIVMELVEGASLADRVKQDGPLSPQRAAEVGLAVLDVLRAAHREGILHRDVKPSNVLLEEGTGRVILTDFGIAKVEGDPSITSTGMLVGAPSYISPERARGKPPGPPADLWSLGGLLFAAVEGRPPYDKGSALSTLTAVMTEPVPRPVRAGGLSEVILGLLRKDPDERLDVDAAQALLKPVAAGEESTPAAGAAASPELPPEPDSGAGVSAAGAAPADGGSSGKSRKKRGKGAGAAPAASAAPKSGGTGESGTGGRAAGSGGDSGAEDAAGTAGAGAGLPDEAVEPSPGGASGAGAAPAKPLGGRVSKRSAVVVAAVVAAVLVFVGAVAFSAGGGDDQGGGSARETEDGKGAAASGGGGDAAGDGEGGENDDSSDSGGDEDTGDGEEEDGEDGLPEGYETVEDGKFHFRMAMPEDFEENGIAGRNSGRRYASSDGLPKLQVDFNSSPQDDAASSWRSLEPATRSSSDGYRRISLGKSSWRDYPTVADWHFVRTEDGEKVRVLNRGFKVDGSHGYAIMITCAEDEWDGEECRTLRDTAFLSFEPLD